jgi:hypothetical protein
MPQPGQSRAVDDSLSSLSGVVGDRHAYPEEAAR